MRHAPGGSDAAMAYLYERLGPKSRYFDRRSGLTPQEWEERLRLSTTVYVGNLSFHTCEDQIYELFGKCGEICMLVMGLNSKSRSPCGFCFVKYFTHSAAHKAVQILNQSTLDGRTIRVDWDTGDGIQDEVRKLGRGVHGMQWRDEFRQERDPARGGEGGGLIWGSNRRKRRFHERAPGPMSGPQFGPSSFRRYDQDM